MYNSSYSHVPGRYTLEAQKKRQQHRSQGKSCGYYMRVVFFFSSLIQSLIIVSLVLFLVYGKKQDSADSGRIADLEQSFSRLSLENVDLRQQRQNLTKTLNLTATERLLVDQEVLAMRNLSSISYNYIVEITNQLNQCNGDLNRYKITSGGTNCPKTKDCAECQTQLNYHKTLVRMLQTEKNQTMLKNTILVDKLRSERDDLSLEAIDLRKDKDTLEFEIQSFRLRCKQDFVSSLIGISNVSRAFLEKIDSLFPQHIPFQLTCEKQRDNLEQIRSNCTSLSREVEDTLQRYLNSVGIQVANTLGQISHLDAENKRLTKDYNWCKQNRTGMILEHRQQLRSAKLRCDEERKELLNDKRSLAGDKEVLNKALAVKESKIEHLQEQIRQLNASCSFRNPYAPAVGRYIPGSTGFNKPVINGINGAFNLGSTGSVGTGLGSTNLGSTNLGSTNLGRTYLGSTNLGRTTLGSTNLGRTNLGSTNPGSTNFGSTNLGSTNLGSTNLGRTNLGSTNLGSTNLGRTNLGSTNLGSTNLGRTTLGSTNFGSTNLGSSLGRITGTGSAGSLGGLGSGRTGSVMLQQHLQELQRYAMGTDKKKKESPRTFG